MARRALLDRVPLPPGNIHPIPCSQSPQEAAAYYETELKSFFGIQPPVFDLVLLGLGDNAHTASLFPHTPVLNEKNRWVAEVYLHEQDMYRVTLTAPIINQARDIIFLVSGANKAPALQKVLQGPFRPHDFPAQLIRPKRTHPLWLVDLALWLAQSDNLHLIQWLGRSGSEAEVSASFTPQEWGPLGPDRIIRKIQQIYKNFIAALDTYIPSVQDRERSMVR